MLFNYFLDICQMSFPEDAYLDEVMDIMRVEGHLPDPPEGGEADPMGPVKPADLAVARGRATMAAHPEKFGASAQPYMRPPIDVRVARNNMEWKELRKKMKNEKNFKHILPQRNKVEDIYTIDTSDLLLKTWKKEKKLLYQYEQMKTVDNLYNKLPKHLRDELEIRKGGKPRNAEKRLFLQKKGKAIHKYKRKVLPRKTKNLFTWERRPRRGKDAKDAKYTAKLQEEKDRIEQEFEKDFLKNPLKPSKKKIKEFKKLEVKKDDGLDPWKKPPGFMGPIRPEDRENILLSRAGFEVGDYRRTEPEKIDSLLKNIIIQKIKKNFHPPVKIRGYDYIREERDDEYPRRKLLRYKHWNGAELEVKLEERDDKELKEALKKWRNAKKVIFDSIRDQNKPPEKIMDKYFCCKDNGEHLSYFAKYGREFKVELPSDDRLQKGLEKWREDYIRKGYKEYGTLKRSKNDHLRVELERAMAKLYGREPKQVKSEPPKRTKLSDKEVERKIKSLSKLKIRSGKRRFKNKSNEIERYDKKDKFIPDPDDEPIVRPIPRRTNKYIWEDVMINLETWENLIQTADNLTESRRLPIYEKILKFLEKIPEGMEMPAEEMFPNLLKVKDMLELQKKYEKKTMQERILVDKIQYLSRRRDNVTNQLTPHKRAQRDSLIRDLSTVREDVDNLMLLMNLPRLRKSWEIEIDTNLTIQYLEKDAVMIRYTPEDNWHFFIPQEQDLPFVAAQEEERYQLQPGSVGGSKFWKKWNLMTTEQKREKASIHKAMEYDFEIKKKEGKRPEKIPSFREFIEAPFSTRIEKLKRIIELQRERVKARNRETEKETYVQRQEYLETMKNLEKELNELKDSKKPDREQLMSEIEQTTSELMTRIDESTKTPFSEKMASTLFPSKDTRTKSGDYGLESSKGARPQPRGIREEDIQRWTDKSLPAPR